MYACNSRALIRCITVSLAGIMLRTVIPLFIVSKYAQTQASRGSLLDLLSRHTPLQQRRRPVRCTVPGWDLHSVLIITQASVVRTVQLHVWAQLCFEQCQYTRQHVPHKFQPFHSLLPLLRAPGNSHHLACIQVQVQQQAPQLRRPPQPHPERAIHTAPTRVIDQERLPAGKERLPRVHRKTARCRDVDGEQSNHMDMEHETRNSTRR